MNIVDTNVLLYAVNEADPRHRESRTWLNDALGGSEAVGFAWLALLGFIRLSTKEGVFPAPLQPDQALGLVRQWTTQRASTFVSPTSRHLDVLAGLIGQLGTGGNLVNDAHLAALAVEHHATIVTYDNDFGRFPGVSWATPGSARR